MIVNHSKHYLLPQTSATYNLLYQPHFNKVTAVSTHITIVLLIIFSFCLIASRAEFVPECKSEIMNEYLSYKTIFFFLELQLNIFVSATF